MPIARATLDQSPSKAPGTLTVNPPFVSFILPAKKVTVTSWVQQSSICNARTMHNAQCTTHTAACPCTDDVQAVQEVQVRKKKSSRCSCCRVVAFSLPPFLLSTCPRARGIGPSSRPGQRLPRSHARSLYGWYVPAHAREHKYGMCIQGIIIIELL